MSFEYFCNRVDLTPWAATYGFGKLSENLSTDYLGVTAGTIYMSTSDYSPVVGVVPSSKSVQSIIDRVGYSTKKDAPTQTDNRDGRKSKEELYKILEEAQNEISNRYKRIFKHKSNLPCPEFSTKVTKTKGGIISVTAKLESGDLITHKFKNNKGTMSISGEQYIFNGITVKSLSRDVLAKAATREFIDDVIHLVSGLGKR